MAVKHQSVLEPRQLNDADEAILDALRDGRATPGHLNDLTGVEQTYINQRLKRLGEHEHVEKLARGLWELTDDPREDVGSGTIRVNADRLHQLLDGPRQGATETIPVDGELLNDLLDAYERDDPDAIRDAVEALCEDYGDPDGE